jgi:hypothetical protein
MVEQKLFGVIKLKGIHDDFVTRDILDYNIRLKHGPVNTIISSGIIKTNNSIYTDFKFSNQIKEFGGSDFLFPLSEYFPSTYDNLTLIFSNSKNNREVFSSTFFSPVKISCKTFETLFEYNDVMYKLSYGYDLIKVPVKHLRLENMHLNLNNKNGKYRLFMWCDTSLGKMNLYDMLISSSDSLIDLRRNVILPDINNEIILKGEIFDSHNISILQFERNLNSDKSIKINENYKKENSIINLSYFVST